MCSSNDNELEAKQIRLDAEWIAKNPNGQFVIRITPERIRLGWSGKRPFKLGGFIARAILWVNMSDESLPLEKGFAVGKTFGAHWYTTELSTVRKLLSLGIPLDVIKRAISIVKCQ